MGKFGCRAWATVGAACDEAKAVKGRCVEKYGLASHQCELGHTNVVSRGDVSAVGEGVC